MALSLGFLGGTVDGAKAETRVVTQTVLNMPLVHQSYNNCGPASLEMLLAYWGIGLGQHEISPLVKPAPRAYMPVNTIAPFAASQGLQTMVVTNANVNTVRQMLALGVPALLLTDYLTVGVVPHWRVVSGFNDAKGIFLIHDPLGGYLGMRYADMQLLWAPHQTLMVLVFPPEWASLIRSKVGA